MLSKKSYLPYLSATITSIIFGLSFLFSKMALITADPFSLLSFRFLTAFVIMSLLICFKVIKVDYKNKPIKNLLILALTEPVIYFIFETYGIKYSSSSLAGIMIALIPVVVTLLGAYFLKEKPSVIQLVFIILSVLGVAFIAFMNNSDSGNTKMLGIILLVITVLSSAVFNILSRKFSSTFTPTEATYFMMGLSAVCFNVISIIIHMVNGNLKDYFIPLLNNNFIISIGYLGILSSVVAFFLVNFTLSKIEASESAVFSNLSTIVSIAAGVIILHENFKYYYLVGSIMIIIGVFGTTYFALKDSKTTFKNIKVKEIENV
jgi:drug/metabolite transporter (DMT)-like permease